MTNVKISISIPEATLRKVDALCKQLNMARSEAIARILEEKLGVEVKAKDHRYPTVLWKLSSTGYLRLRSPRLRGRSIKEKWIVEEVEEK
ncbi:MAG: ribbon-helix-helix protein, CopG family [Candidatus Brockarchaeota archaeon]|nr:ribbon-helix-helix protein, CopG family [Candidatus Brockarchaeota archaeon]MBO3808730.1 ribbon-helix-helix protein, CopG family [Candidatus Brockarchaeota archaeon]